MIADPNSFLSTNEVEEESMLNVLIPNEFALSEKP